MEKNWSPVWTGWTLVSRDRYIKEEDQIAVFAGRVFRTKEAAEKYYQPIAGERVVQIGVKP